VIQPLDKTKVEAVK